eukprot:CAMPEP_0183359842 /NCGR_PEP_ID=MMETSP0164_2-20130417/53486_1 /TAXON_ID=221442 /ORGANISM="Coccolithus pelagicus ssp braarudi, Strain PLY182g" /LENGTH=547 /DNA_ID=CAMNT_0025534053 /DNA_START=9 /DNA_END=1653 /DNA_ORIENTATION=-
MHVSTSVATASLLGVGLVLICSTVDIMRVRSRGNSLLAWLHSSLCCRFVRDAFKSSTASDWAFLAEGALNLTCTYVGTDPLLKGRVLRLRKHNPDASMGANRSEPYTESIKFEERVILPLLGRRYVQPSIEVPVTTTFLDGVGANISSDRSARRRVHTIDPLLQTALIMNDNTRLPLKDGAGCICIELKVKCGTLSTRPWVSHQVKRRVSKFAMHQQLKCEEGKLGRPSLYSPLDLFSGDAARIRAALDALVATPQNNLQLFASNALLFPSAHGLVGGMQAFDAALSSVNGFSGNASRLLAVLTSILEIEPILPRLLAAQQLDDCDIEGAAHMYEEIVARGEAIAPLADGPALQTHTPPPRELPTSASEQHLLVRRFLVSKTAKDCSVMITLQPDDSADQAMPPRLPDLPVELTGERTIVRGFMGYAYSIAVVDLDPKPQAKMRHYLALDDTMARVYADLEQKKALRNEVGSDKCAQHACCRKRAHWEGMKRKSRIQAFWPPALGIASVDPSCTALERWSEYIRWGLNRASKATAPPPHTRAARTPG